MSEINLSRGYENEYSLINGQLYKSGKRYTICEEKEVVEYFKDKHPIFFNTEDSIYILANDKSSVINTKCHYDVRPIETLFVKKIIIKHKNEFITVWSRDIEIFDDQDNFTIVYDDGYKMTYKNLWKPVTENIPCSIEDTMEFYKDNIIRVKTCEAHWYYLLNGRKNMIDDDGRMIRVDASADKIESVSALVNNEWIYIWKKENQSNTINLRSGFEIHLG